MATRMSDGRGGFGKGKNVVQIFFKLLKAVVPARDHSLPRTRIAGLGVTLSHDLITREQLQKITCRREGMQFQRL